MSTADIVSLVFAGLPLIDWSAVWVLTRALARFPFSDTLRERRRVAVAVASLTTVFAGLGLARLGHIPISGDVAVVAIGVSVVGLSVVNLVFLFKYWKAAFQ